MIKTITTKHIKTILKKNSGRNNQGKITTRHQGGRHKRFYRHMDFCGKEMMGTIITIERDPNRSANIALVKNEDNSLRYIVHPDGLRIGDTITMGDKIDIKIGNRLFLENIPLGQEIHNIELYPGSGGILVKSAGAFAVIVAKGERYADIKLPSKEIRKILLTCRATIGRVGNIEYKIKKLTKAGQKRRRGIRPTVRGVAQNPRSHPHGGGEGRSGEGMHAKTPWGKQARGKKTRRNKRSTKLIVKTRRQSR